MACDILAELSSVTALGVQRVHDLDHFLRFYVLVSSLGNQMFKWFQKRCGFNLLFEGDLSPLPDWFELEQVVHVLDQQSAWQMDTDRIRLKVNLPRFCRVSRGLR